MLKGIFIFHIKVEWYLSINYRRKLEIFNKKCLFWFTVLQNYSQQLAASNTQPISYYFVLYDMVFLSKAINNKHDLNLSTYICFSKPSKDLRSSKHQQLLPVERCCKLSVESPSFKESVATPTSSLQERFTFLTHLKNLNMN